MNTQPASRRHRARLWRWRLWLVAAAILALVPPAAPAVAEMGGCGTDAGEATAGICAVLEEAGQSGQPAKVKAVQQAEVEAVGYHVTVDFGSQAVPAELLHDVIAAAATTRTTLENGGAARRVDKLNALTLANLVVEELRIEDVALDLSLKFDQARFAMAAAGSNSADLACGDPNSPRQHPTLVFNYAELRQLEVADSTLCGLQITNSTIAQGLKVVNTKDTDAKKGTNAKLSYLWLIKSRVGTEVSITGMVIDDLQIDRNELEALTLRDSELHAAQLTRNRLESLQSWHDSYIGALVISGNRVGASVDLLVAGFDTTDPLQIRDNDIGGRLFVTFRPGGDGKRTIDLGYNNVGHDSNIWLPVDREIAVPVDSKRLTVDLTSSRFATALRLCYAEAVIVDQATTMMPVPPQAVGYGDGCVAPSRLPPVTLTMTAAEVGAMGMMLPHAAKLEWGADGFRYRYWGVADKIDRSDWQRARTDPIPDRCVELVRAPACGRDASLNTIAGLHDLHSQLSPTGKGDALLNMANYFKEHGAFLESRLSLLWAKVDNYWASIRAARTPTLASLVGALFAVLALILLAPVGYGAFPEFALLLLLILWLGGYLWYDIYRERHESRWEGIRAEVRKSGANPAGYSDIAGFMQFDKDRLPREFSLLIYSADALLPVVDLHAYGQYFPRETRWVPGLQHFCGWVLLSVFLASITVL